MEDKQNRNRFDLVQKDQEMQQINEKVAMMGSMESLIK
jgi:hypothetical protein